MSEEGISYFEVCFFVVDFFFSLVFSYPYYSFCVL